MEFLADSIGLLDMDGRGGGDGGSSSRTTTPPESKSASHRDGASISAASCSSLLSCSKHNNIDDGHLPQNELNSSHKTKKKPEKQPAKECDRCTKNAFNLALENLSDMDSCCRCDCRRRQGGSHSIPMMICDDEDDFRTDQSDEEEIIANESTSPQSSSASPTLLPPNISNTTISNNYHNNTRSTQLTRWVTQRIDARTSFNCFTGNVDAITGEIIHGTLVYRFTGEVYEGPFRSVPRQQQNDHHNHNLVAAAPMFQDQFIPDNVEIETVSLRHGSNATSHFTNGMTFTGTYELDHPKFGKWIMKDDYGNDEWMYEGPLIFVGVDCNNRTTSGSSSILRGRSISLSSIKSAINNNSTTHTNSAPSSGSLEATTLISTALSTRVIGISNPLPGSVLFHGNGKFTRYTPIEMSYKGEFYYGMAHGVGKEIVFNHCGVGVGGGGGGGGIGGGMSVYQGEFRNGMRHGVGVIMEEVDDNDEKGEDEYCDKCNCTLLASDESHDDNIKARSLDDGPDFAAGGSNKQEEEEEEQQQHQEDDDNENDSRSLDESSTKRSRPASSLSQPISKPCKGCGQNIMLHQRQPRRKQRYSSGVWCAGQFEIQDVVGTVRHSSDGSKEFVEDKKPSSVTSTGTTWDMIPEKWLGLG